MYFYPIQIQNVIWIYEKVVNVLPFLSVFLSPNETFIGVPVFVSQSLSHLPFCTFLSLFFFPMLGMCWTKMKERDSLIAKECVFRLQDFQKSSIICIYYTNASV